MWTCGWWVIAEPQLCSTAVVPIAAAAVEYDEPEALLRAEPFHGRAGRRPRRQLAASRRRTKPARAARRKNVIIEASPPRLTKTSLTHQIW
jgi:hypothetical protein